MNSAAVLDRMFPVKDMSRGKASSILAGVEDGLPAFILKNNAPYRVVITPAEYARFVEAEEALNRSRAIEWASRFEWDSPEDMNEHVEVYRRVADGMAGSPLSGRALGEAAATIVADFADLAEEAFNGER